MRLFFTTTLLILALTFPAFAGDMVVIGNVDFPVSDVTQNTVKKIYLGLMKKQGSVRLNPYDLPDNNDLKTEFIQKMLDFKTLPKYNGYWIGKVFKEGGVPPSIKPGVNDLIKAVAANPGGIGYCKKSEAQGKSGIKILLEVD